MSNAYKSSVRKPGGKRLLGGPRHRRGHNIKITLKKCDVRVCDAQVPGAGFCGHGKGILIP
jgi:hypothetical protein